MSEFDNHVAILGDWTPPISSPGTFFSSVIDDEIMSRSMAESSTENRSESLNPGPEFQVASRSTDLKDKTLASVVGDETNKPQTNSRGGLMERMTARAGFNAPRLNTESIGRSGLSQNPEVWSPYLTIPPGLSPATLLDSPVFLSNSLVHPSPTTGKFSFGDSESNQNSVLITDNPEKFNENIFEGANTAPFDFKPVRGSDSWLYYGAATETSGNPSRLSQQLFPSIDVSVHSENSLHHQSIEPLSVPPSNCTFLLQTDFSKLSAENSCSSLSSDQRTYNAVDIAEHSASLTEPQKEDADQSITGDLGCVPAEDGYTWRKYGQKQVQGSGHPRSYYKCTFSNCPVTKKVEQSHEGHITEIIYKGAHNHQKPLLNPRTAIVSSTALCEMQHSTTEHPGTVADGDHIWSTIQKTGAPDSRPYNLKLTSSVPVSYKYRNGALSLPVHSGTQFVSGEVVDGSPAVTNDEDEDDRGTHGSSLGNDGEGDELESKRRRIETSASEIHGAARAIRESRVVVQTTSEVDILDDGYRWRKYGQKVVKGNPNPRSYYKCTSPGCNVRKHVERAAHDVKSVITTYEGKHNHNVPAARNSSHISSGVSNIISAQAPDVAPSLVYSAEPPQVHNSMARFERPSFGLPGRPLLGPTPGFGFGMNQPNLVNLAMVGLGPSQGKLSALPGHPYLGQHYRMNDTGFMLPKEEPKVEPASHSAGSSVYHQIMNRWPPGPQI